MAVGHTSIDPAEADKELAPARPSAGSIPAALLLAMRPKQWPKNLFVFVALLFTNQLPSSLHDPRWGVLTKSLWAFVLFCIVSGSIYMLNDVFDRKQDRLHPEKRKRPIASGRLPWQIAIAASIFFGLGGVAAGFIINT